MSDLLKYNKNMTVELSPVDLAIKSIILYTEQILHYLNISPTHSNITC